MRIKHRCPPRLPTASRSFTVWPTHYHSPLANSAPAKLTSLLFIKHSWLIFSLDHSRAWKAPAQIHAWIPLTALPLCQKELIYSWNGKTLSLSLGEPGCLVSPFAQTMAVGFVMGSLKFTIRSLEALRMRCLCGAHGLPALSLLHCTPYIEIKASCELTLGSQVPTFKHLNWVNTCTSSSSLLTYPLLNRAHSFNHIQNLSPAPSSPPTLPFTPTEK